MELPKQQQQQQQQQQKIISYLAQPAEAQKLRAGQLLNPLRQLWLCGIFAIAIVTVSLQYSAELKLG
jgi:hypothetical protein